MTRHAVRCKRYKDGRRGRRGRAASDNPYSHFSSGNGCLDQAALSGGELIFKK
jgi:hypothetical protein